MDVNFNKTEKIMANRKRSKRLSYLKRQNMKLATEIQRYMKKNTPIQGVELLDGLVRNLKSCSNFTLYGQTGQNIRLLTAITCNHKLCCVCNWNRQKKIRRKYFRWFENNKTLCKIGTENCTTYCTHAQLNDYLNKGFKLYTDKIEYDLMHLTLTVPHSATGWRGQKIYFSEIMKAYNDMRHYDEWKNLVYGGEYGVETTKNESGYHTHIHSLVFVKKGTQNRNLLHLNVLQMWNKLTVDSNAERNYFDDTQRVALKKGNKLLTDREIDRLNPKGATLIGLKCLYTTQNGIKTYTKEWGSEAMMKGVMETISYHFKPQLFQLSEHTLDVESIVDMLPKVYGKILYRKFGVLHGEKSLNVKDNSLVSDFEETTEDYDEETGEVFDTQYFITNPLNVYAKGVTNEISLSKRVDMRIQVLKAHSSREAVQQLNGLIKKI